MDFRPRLAVGSLALLCCWALGASAYGDTASDNYTLDLPFQPNLATPVWLGHPVTPAGSFASLDLPLTIPDAGDSLLVTIAFQEKEGGFLRITWKNQQGEQELSSNFYEGIGMENQRSILIPAQVLQGPGTLCLQCGDATLDVQSVKLQWMQEKSALVSPELMQEEVIPQSGKSVPEPALDGQPPRPESSRLDGSLVTVPLSATPTRIEQGVEFSMQLESSPKAARVAFQEAGLPFGQHFVLWINQQRAGTITPAVPDLGDAGFNAMADASQTYAGWRDGSLYLSGALLKSGINTLQLSVESDTAPLASVSTDDATAAAPLAINHFICQFDYSAPAGLSTAITSPATSSSVPDTATPTGAIIPASPSADGTVSPPMTDTSLSLRPALP